MEIPAALLVDLSGLSVSSVPALTVFSAVWMRTADWPGVPLVLFGELAEGASLLAASRISRFIPVRADLRAAKLALRAPPTRRRATVDLPWATAASAAARRFVRDVCEDWSVTAEVAGDAAAVLTELVENTLQHTHAEPRIRAELREGMLTVAVADTDPGSPVPVEENDRRHGWGLRLVARLSTAWGCTPAADGKIVWAVLLGHRD